MARIVKEEEYAGKRNAILDVAQRLIYTKGYEQMTIQGMLDDLQISKGAFYHYFDSKQAVLERVWYADDNAIVRQKLRATAMREVAPLFAEIIRQGNQEGVMTATYPDQVGEVIASLAQDAGETIGALLLSFDAERDDMQRVERTVAVYTDAIERVLGVPPGALSLVDDQTLKEWFVSPRENEVEMES